MDGVGMGGGFGGRDMTPMGRMGGKSTTSPSTQLSLTCAASVDSHVCVCVLDMYRSGMGMMDRDFGRSDMGMNRPFGDSFGGLGKCVNISRCTHMLCLCCDVLFLYQVEEWGDMEVEWGTLAWAQWARD